MDPLSLSTELLTLVQGAVAVVKYIQEVKEGGEERERLIQDITRLIRLLGALKVELDQAKEGDPWFVAYRALAKPDGTLKQLERLVDNLNAELHPNGELRRLRQKLIWPLSKNRVKDSVDTIERYCREIEHLLSRGHFDLSKSIWLDVIALRNEYIQTTFAAITSWLSPLKFETRQDQLLSGTVAAGQWFFDSPEFERWVSGEERALMCYGAPGAGKTVLLSLVIERLQQSLQMSKTPVLFIYLTHKESREQSLSNLLGALLRQLIQFKGQISKEIEDFYNEGKKEVRPAASKLFDLLAQELKAYPKAYIVVDALDESDEDTRKSFIDYLLRIEGQFSLLWTARSLGDMIGFRSQYCNFCGFICGKCDADNTAPQCHDCQEHCELCGNLDYQPSYAHSSVTVQITARDNDVRMYIDKHIKESSRLHQVCLKDSNLRAKIADTIISSTQGIFLIARLQMDFLRTKLPTPKTILVALKNLPTAPKDLFAEALTRIHNQNPEDVEMAMRLLGWVAFAYRPLAFSELQHAMGVAEDDVDLEPGELLDKDFLLTLTAGLITVDSEGDAVRLIHSTVYEYLYERKEELFPDLICSMATTILTYLNFESFSQPCRGEREDEEVETRLRRYPLLSYASICWGEHASECYQDDKGVKAAVLALVRNPLKLASSIQAAWYSSCFWNARKGLSSLHVCAWFGLDEIIPDLLKQGLAIDSPDLTYGQTPLMYASKNGRISTIKTLLDLGANINHKSATDSTALLEAIRAGELKVAEYLVRQPSLQINSRAPSLWNRTILILGVCYEYVDLVRFALSRPDIQINAQDISGDTALHVAASVGSYELALLIINHQDTDVNLKNAHKATPLLMAAEGGDENVVELLLTNGADASLQDELGGTPILRAVDYGHVEVLKIMLQYSVDFRGVDKLGRTILHGASINGYSDIVRTLVDTGLAVDARGDAGETALHDAGRNGSVSVAETLLELGANPLIRDRSGRTPRVVAEQGGNEDVAQLLKEKEMQLGLDPGDNNEAFLPAWSIAKKNRPDLMEVLIARGGDPNEEDPDTGSAPLHFAAWSNYVEILEQLLQTNANPDPINKFNRTPLKQAAIRGNVEATQLLLKYGARTDLEGETDSALTLAQCNKRFKVAILLIKAGAKIDSLVMPLQPTFFAAIINGDIDAVRILIEHGAETQARDPHGHTPLQLAKLHDQPEVMRVLREHKSFFIPSRTASETSIGANGATSPPALRITTKDSFRERPSG